jgi:hypothetical protein
VSVLLKDEDENGQRDVAQVWYDHFVMRDISGPCLPAWSALHGDFLWKAVVSNEEVLNNGCTRLRRQ